MGMFFPAAGGDDFEDFLSPFCIQTKNIYNAVNTENHIPRSIRHKIHQNKKGRSTPVLKGYTVGYRMSMW